jgi:hypothetical protein
MSAAADPDATPDDGDPDEEVRRDFQIPPDTFRDRIPRFWQGSDTLQTAVGALSGKTLKESFMRLTFTENFLGFFS